MLNSFCCVNLINILLLCFAFLAQKVHGNQEVCLSIRLQNQSNSGGPPGPPGPPGPKGDQGSPGTCGCRRSEIQRLNSKIEEFSNSLLRINQRIERIENESEARGQTSRTRRGWYTPGNGYQYFLSPTNQNWQNSRRYCQSLGADLAAVGLRDFTTLRELSDVYTRTRPAWIGLNDINNGGRFEWVDGVISTRENSKWHTNEPSSSGEDCAELNYTGHPRYTLNDASCSINKAALCEARIQ